MIWDFWVGNGLGLLGRQWFGASDVDRQWFGASDVNRSCQMYMQVIVMLCKSTVMVNCD